MDHARAARVPSPAEPGQSAAQPLRRQAGRANVSGVVKLANTPSSSQADPLVFIDKPKGHVKSAGQGKIEGGRTDSLAFVDKSKKDPLAFLDKGKGKGKADPLAFVDRSKSSSKGMEKMPDALACVGGDDEVEYDDEYSDDNGVPNTIPGFPPARKKLKLANTPRGRPAPLRKENSSASTGAGRLSKAAKPTPNPTKNPATSSSPAPPTASTPSSKKRQAPADGAAGAPPKRKLTDFFARK